MRINNNVSRFPKNKNKNYTIINNEVIASYDDDTLILVGECFVR